MPPATAGDPAASDLMQEAKSFADTVLHTAEDSDKAASTLGWVAERKLV